MSLKKYKKYKKQLEETFDSLSSTYINEFTSNPSEEFKLRSLINLWGIKSGSTILEVGGGTGDLSPFLLEKLGGSGKLVFLDISAKMIEKATEKLKKYKNIEFIHGDIHNFTYSRKFQSIVIFNTFPHFTDKKTAFLNCHDLLNKNGKLIISHNNSRWDIVGNHKRESVASSISDFPDDFTLHNILKKIGYEVEVFENNNGYDYYLVIARKTN